MATIVLEHSDSSGSERLGMVLRDHGHRLDVRQVHHGDPVPRDLDDVDAVLVCGGPQAPDDDAPAWMKDELDFIRAAHEGDVPLLGICLGCQLVTRALGGTVERTAEGEYGWHDVSLSPTGREDPLFAGHPWRTPQVHWHRYRVRAAPPDARILASSERTPIQAWVLGLRTYALQYHPEVGPQAVLRWADQEPEALPRAATTMDQLRARTEQLYPAFARINERLFERVASLLMPVDRRFAGIVKDLEH